MGASSGRDDDMALERQLGAPRLTFGLDVHRRVHARAVGARGYGLQWKAFCERAKLDALDGTSEDAEAILANFHFQLEDGASRFEADAGEGWPPGAHHPVQVSTFEHPSAPVPPQLLGAFQPAPPTTSIPPPQLHSPSARAPLPTPPSRLVADDAAQGVMAVAGALAGACQEVTGTAKLFV